jgi:succinyl-CoA synthetase alpha subunit
MKLNEHQSKLLLSEAGIPVPEGILLDRSQLDGASLPFPFPVVAKAQVLAGGRGKAGGVRIVPSQREWSSRVAPLFDLTIGDQPVPLVRVEQAAPISRELYLSCAVHRAGKAILLTAGRQGGVDIESCPPEDILSLEIDPACGLHDYQIRDIFFHFDLDRRHWAEVRRIASTLYARFTDMGLLLAEINPLALTEDDRLLALDGKVELDDNMVAIDTDQARFEQPEHRTSQENMAEKFGLSFHSLKGYVGLMVNGAGLAMATMDSLNFSGLPAANFLDLGGKADKKAMRAAFDILFEDSGVRVVFINIFAGILSCERVADSMLAALEGTRPQKPMVIRFSGNGYQKGRAMIEGMGFPNVHLVEDLPEGISTLRSLVPPPADTPDFPRIEIPEHPPLPAGKTTAKATPFPLTESSRILVQGITGREGGLHARLMQEYGTNIVAGVTPFKGGTTCLDVPVYDTVRRACRDHRVEATVIFVPPPFAADAIIEAADAGVPWIVCITEGIPQHRMLCVLERLEKSPSRLIGPNTPGLIVPGRTKLGIMPGHIFTPGEVAVFSRSGTLTYESVVRLSNAGIGQSVCVGIGGDPFIGQNFVNLCQRVRHDGRTRAVLALGEIGGTAEEELAQYVRESGFELPVIGFVAGQTAPAGKRLGHAGAILEHGKSGIREKLTAMHAAGITICPDLDSIPGMVQKRLAPQ